MRDPVLAAEKFPPTSISFGKDNARRGRLRSIAPYLTLRVRGRRRDNDDFA